MFAPAGRLAVHVVALAAALQLFAVNTALQACQAVSQAATQAAGKGATRCLRALLAVLGGGSAPPVEPSLLSYAHAAVSGIVATVKTAFHNKSYWTAVALLDVSALWAVLRRHKSSHAEAAAAASVRRAAADLAEPATRIQEPAKQNLPLLQAAAVHSKAAYSASAASGYLSSAAGYISLLTICQATSKAPRRIPAAQHISGVQQLTGCPAQDILAAQWQSHLHRPAFYVAIDRQRHMVVVSVRGTLQLGDYCTVLDAVPQPITLCGVSGHVHGGFLTAARNLLPAVTAALRSAASACPGWPLLITGHSLGGGVAAVLTLLLLEERQLEQREERDSGHLCQLGDISCVGIGTAAAFCELLGSSCKQYITSVLYGSDCLPMFSVLGARLLIEEVHQTSKAAAAFGRLLRRARSQAGGRRLSIDSACSEAGSVGGLGRSSSNASSVASFLSSDTAYGSGGHRRSPSSLAPPDCLGDVEEIEEAAAAAAGTGTTVALDAEAGSSSDGHRLQRCSSAWSAASTSTASLAAFAAECCSRQGAGAALVPMFPPGRLLWLLPPEGSSSEQPLQQWRRWLLQQFGSKQAQQGGQRQQAGKQRPTLVETDQSAFERFLLTLDTTAHHLPDSYQEAIAALAQLSE